MSIDGLSNTTNWVVIARSLGFSEVSSAQTGAFSPALVAWLALQFDLGEPEAELLLLKPLVPVLVGAAWPWALPLLADGVKKLWQGWISRFGGGRHE